jgi:integrase
MLGTYGSAASKAEYNRVIGEWIANGRQMPKAPADLSVAELMARYKVHCDSYYRRADGTRTGESETIGHALRPLRKLYGSMPAAEFSPLKLMAVREAMIDPKSINPGNEGPGLCRTSVNKQCNRIRQMFRWAVKNELVPPSVIHGLQAVDDLKAGRTVARETEPVQPVPDDVVERTLPFLSSVVSTMVQLQRLTGARPDELCQLRTVDLDQSTAVWIYTPEQHKTAHRGKHRSIAIGPRAQELITPFLKPLNPTAFIFDPADAMAEMRERRRAGRKTQPGRGNGPGTNVKSTPRRKPRSRYTTDTYRRSIHRACDLAFPVPADATAKEIKTWKSDHRWAPNQLRHSLATEVRKRFGLEGAQVVLGHANADVTQVYAERDRAAASRIAAEVG